MISDDPIAKFINGNGESIPRMDPIDRYWENSTFFLSRFCWSDNNSLDESGKY